MSRVGVIGATGGLGRALALEYARKGWRVGVSGRSAEKLEGVLSDLERGGATGVVGGICDVRDSAAVASAFDRLSSHLGGMDVLIYCAGVMPTAGTMDERLAGAAETFEVNVVGAVRFLERGAEYMAGRKAGRLAAVGSIAGVRGRKGNAVYGASKAALHVYLEGLRHRLHGSGVGVSTIKPGYVETPMLGNPTPRFPPPISSGEAARLIARGLERGRDDFFVPWWWGLVGAALRTLPGFAYKRIAPP